MLDGYHATNFVGVGQTGNFITTISVGGSGLLISGTGVGRTLTNTGLVGVTNSTLTRSGANGTYTVGLNLGNANTWTAIQNFCWCYCLTNYWVSVGGSLLLLVEVSYLKILLFLMVGLGLQGLAPLLVMVVLVLH